MTAEAYYLLRKGEQVLAFQDLDDVALLRAILTRAGDPIARGTEGTIVGVHEDGSAYEVEFAEPDGAIATVEARDLRLVRSFAGLAPAGCSRRRSSCAAPRSSPTC